MYESNFFEYHKSRYEQRGTVGIIKRSSGKNEIGIDEKVLRDVYLAACKAYEGKKRYSGEEYVTHPINVAILLAELGAEHDAVLAGMFCDVTTKGNDIELENELPVNVWNIVKQLEEKESNEAICKTCRKTS